MPREANLSPVWGLSLAGGLTAVLAAPGEPVGSVTVDGVEHSVERVTDPVRLAEISAHVGGDDVLIADGHHRYSISRTYRDEVRARTGSHDSPAELTLAFVSELVEDQLSVAAIHRVYRSIDREALVAALDVGFEMSPAGPVRCRHAGRDAASADRWCSSTATATGRGSTRAPVPSTASARSTVRGSSTCSQPSDGRGRLSARPRRAARA